MKKVLFLFVVATVVMTSCIRNQKVECDCAACNAKIPTNTAAIITHYINVETTDWNSYNNPSNPEVYTYATFDDDAITKNVIEQGAVLAYVVESQDNLLPYVFPQDLYDGGGNYVTTIMQNYRFDLNEGQITFILEASDKELYWPSNKLQFKVVIFSPNY